jgi:hypothetical protein
VHILVLASTENPGLYETAAKLADMGCNVSYYFPDSSTHEPAIDKHEVVHISSWRPHMKDADLILTNDLELLYAYERSGGAAPIMYHANSLNGNIYIPPMARDIFIRGFVSSYAERERPWWKFWSRNG